MYSDVINKVIINGTLDTLAWYKCEGIWENSEVYVNQSHIRFTYYIETVKTMMMIIVLENKTSQIQDE